MLRCGQVVTDPRKLQFYDVWVGRDAEGKPLSNTHPYVMHQYSVQRIYQGLPFPVACCWNGMVSANAEPFSVGGYKFRRASAYIQKVQRALESQLQKRV